MTKRAPNGNGCIRLRSDGRWEGNIQLGVDANGKKIKKYIYGKTQKEVAEQIRKVSSQKDEGLFSGTPSKMTLQSWLDIWLNEYCNSIKENTLVSYRVQVENNISPYLGNAKLSKIKPHDIQSVINKLYNKPLSSKSVKNVYGILHKALEQAVKNEYIPRNPCEGVQLRKVVKKEISPLEEAELRDFLNVIKGHPNEVLFKVAVFTGMRQGELMGLTWENVDFKEGTILVKQQLIHEKQKGGAYKFGPTKTGGIRKLTPAPQVMQWLREWKKKQASMHLLLGSKWDDTLPGLVFTNEFGHNLSNTTLSHQAKKLAEKIGKEDFRFHDLRHTYACLAIRAGDDMKTISTNLGHSSISITMDIYASFTSDMAKASSNRMDQYISATF